MSHSFIELDVINIFKIFLVGLFFDLGTLSYLMFIYCLYLLVFPSKLNGKRIDVFFTKCFYFFFLFIITFSFLSEITFWREYNRRFNFIAVDYLLYTYEVISNINESYPIPILLSGIVIIIIGLYFFARKSNIFDHTFNAKENLFQRSIFLSIFFSVLFLFHYNIKNEYAELSNNIYENELSKAGIFSFFEAYNSNELNFFDLYISSNLKNIEEEEVFKKIKNSGKEKTPNVIFIGLESFSANFMNYFGDENNLSPTLDSIAKKSIFFTNFYATGTRTIRGLESVVLSIPPTPGRSIIKRKNNKNLYNIGSVFEEKGYTKTFFYGGDGYFDNMNLFFGNNGFEIVDRRKKFRHIKQFETKRINIEDKEVTFENPWGVCDEDLLNKVLKVSDSQHKSGVPFFNFVMTSSNHQPYTYPEGKVDIPSGNNRYGAVKYSDFALSEFFKKAIKKEWFNNTVFVIMSDHCAYSAGKTEINIKSHHIPAMIYNLNKSPKIISKLSSQIDLFPTLFGYLNWSYSSTFFGKDINKMSPLEERAFIANHRKIGLLKKNKLIILSPNKKADLFDWDSINNEIKKIKMDSSFLDKTVQYYQSAYELYKSGELNLN
ncbi:MAG: LTA synthase family protein [Flavobacteriaceae bacterium]|nr:LTA synthase family protein [Flavobacteriaceae bacterium]